MTRLNQGDLNAVDCQGLAGAFTCGVHQAGFRVLGKYELPGGFGAESVTENLNVNVKIGPWQEWDPHDAVDLLFGNPPCSGFSLLNTSAAGSNKDGKNVRNHRGWDSPINDCMWALAEYATRTNSGRGPLYYAMESVQQAYKQGRVLMQKLRDRVEAGTGREYALTHLLISGNSTGAAQRRHRYYMVMSRHPAPQFRVRIPDPSEPVTYRDAIGDLLGYDWQTYEPQPFKAPPETLYQANVREMSPLLRDHFAPGPEVGTKHTTQVYALLDGRPGWQVGWNMEDAARAYHAYYGELPPGFNEEQILRKVKRKDPEVESLEDAERWHLGFHQPRRVPWDKPGYVVTGSGGFDFIHPQEDRFLTVRECARLQGFPDWWSFDRASSFRQSYSWIGKGVPVPTGRWVAQAVRASLSEDEGVVGEEIGDRERLIDLTNAWQPVDRRRIVVGDAA